MRRLLSNSKLAFEKIKKQLERQKKVTEHQLEEIKQEDPFSDEQRLVDNADIGLEAGDQIGHDRAVFLKRELESSLALIRKALSKIGVGKYGYCEKCGKLIDKARLEVYPLAVLCFDCEKKKSK